MVAIVSSPKECQGKGDDGFLARDQQDGDAKFANILDPQPDMIEAIGNINFEKVYRTKLWVTVNHVRDSIQTAWIPLGQWLPCHR